jgi:hypothetical protein
MNEQIKESYEDGFAEINGRKYSFGKVNHKTRLKIFGFAQSIMGDMSRGNMSFMGSDEYSKIEDIIFANVTFDNSSLSKLPNHFEEYGADYILFVSSAIGVFTYPFMKGTS